MAISAMRPGVYAWSPDSAYVAYSASADGVSNIWLANADGRQNTPLTNNQEMSETYCCAAWTPDGKSLVFTSEVKGGNARQKTYRLWLYQLEDREQQMVFESTDPFRFLGLANGGKDAIISQKDDPADLTATPKSTNVYSLSLQTGAKSKVNALENAYFHNVHLSRDGGLIAFVSRQDNDTTLWTVPVSGGSPKTLLIENDPKVLISSLAWSPDGRSIVFGKQTRTTLLSMLTN
jgi:Tol biopolymer transport system component